MHTPLCHHAVGAPEEYAEEAARRGLAGIVVTCHNPMPDGYSPSTRMREDQFDQYLRMVRRARQAFLGDLDVRLGLECDFLPNYVPWLETQTRSEAFDYVLGSVHPHLPEYRARYWHGNALEFQRTYFDHLARAAESGLFDCLAHPDLVKNVTPDEWEPERLRPDVERSLERIAATGCALELNTSGLRKTVSEMNPGTWILRMAARFGIPIVVGGDAHQPSDTGAHLKAALAILRDVGYARVTYFLERDARHVTVSQLLSEMSHHAESTTTTART